MVLLRETSSRRRLAVLLGCTLLSLALLLPVARDASGASVAALAARLADDTRDLAEAREALEETRSELREVTAERRRLWATVGSRLAALYKHSTSTTAITRMTGGESMEDVGESIDVLNHVAEHDAAAIERWQALDARRTKLIARRAKLRRQVKDAERAVAEAREELSAAERAAAQARREAARMARIQESLLLPKVISPETEAARAGDTSGETAPATQPIGFQQSGEASVYHDSFAGEETANGEFYDPGAFTAAHPSLPFGTWVTVNGPGGSVAVRINDRGPFVGGRIIDLSPAAANAIGLGGLGNVTLAVAA